MKTPTWVSAVLICCLFLSCAETRSAQYATGAEALASEEAQHGWIPKWLPSGSQDVRLQYNLDTNEIWLRFALRQPQRSGLSRGLKTVSDDDVKRIPFPRARGAAWWPDGLARQQAANNHALDASLFTGDNVAVPSTDCFAFDRCSDDVYAWRAVE